MSLLHDPSCLTTLTRTENNNHKDYFIETDVKCILLEEIYFYVQFASGVFFQTKSLLNVVIPVIYVTTKTPGSETGKH